MMGCIDRAIVRMTKRLSRKGLYEFLANEYSKIPQGAHVLTVGAGGDVNDLLRKHANRQDFHVLSLDVDPSRKPDTVGDICDPDFGDRKFDVIVMSEVLEHVHSPHLALRNVHEVLKEGGVLVLTVPFMLPAHDRPHDYYRFTIHGLELLLQDFRDVTIRERNSYFEAIDVMWARLWQTKVKAARLLCYVVVPFLILKSPLTRLLSSLIKTDAMTTGYVATARK